LFVLEKKTCNEAIERKAHKHTSKCMMKLNLGETKVIS